MDRMDRIDRYRRRWQALQKKLIANHSDGMIVTQNVDIYYLTGTTQVGYLFVPAQGDPAFFVRRSITRALQESAVPVEPLGSPRLLVERMHKLYPQIGLKNQTQTPCLATEFDVIPVSHQQRLEKSLPKAQWVDGSIWLREVRMIKSPEEADIIRQAAQLIDRALEHAVNFVRPGMPEVELMAEIEHYLRLRGHLGIMRMRGYNQEIITGMVGAGEAAAMPTYFEGPAGGSGISPAVPQSSGLRPIGRNEPILVDIGCCIEGYVIDQTRTLVIGSLSEPLEHAYSVAEQILRDTEKSLCPGTICESLYVQACDTAERAGLAQHFMGYDEDQVKFLGHGIGLEIDELPVLARGFKQPLEAGMTIAIEPKFTFPGVGVVGIENSYLITDEGFENLCISREGIIRVGG
jgi:Xaa-Pro aminopeptidase